MISILRIFKLLIFALLITNFAIANNYKLTTDSLNIDTVSFNKNSIWINIGGSFGKNAKFLNVGYDLSLNISMFYNKVIKLKSAYHSDFILFEIPQKIYELNLMVGFLNCKKNRITEFTIGVGYVTGTRNGKYYSSTGFSFFSGGYEKIKFAGISLPMEISINWASKYFRFLGFGLGFEANINENIPYLGGKIRILINHPLNKNKLIYYKFD